MKNLRSTVSYRSGIAKHIVKYCQGIILLREIFSKIVTLKKPD